RRHRQPARNTGGRLADRGSFGLDCGILSSRERSDYLRHDGGRAAAASTRTVRRRRNVELSAEQTRKLIVLSAIWVLLIFAPYWMAPLGGYTALATRILVLGLAAMSVNFLLGFT